MRCKAFYAKRHYSRPSICNMAADNAAKLNKYYPRQFQQIVNCLCENTAEDIVEKCNYIREQMLRFPENHGVDVSAFPQLSLTDFWLMKEE